MRGWRLQEATRKNRERCRKVGQAEGQSNGSGQGKRYTPKARLHCNDRTAEPAPCLQTAMAVSAGHSEAGFSGIVQRYRPTGAR
jgi:hypothetical protein